MATAADRFRSAALTALPRFSAQFFGCPPAVEHGGLKAKLSNSPSPEGAGVPRWRELTPEGTVAPQATPHGAAWDTQTDSCEPSGPTD